MPLIARSKRRARVSEPSKRSSNWLCFGADGILVLRVDNWFDGQLHVDAGERLTTIKADAMCVMDGAWSIQWTARKYGGK